MSWSVTCKVSVKDTALFQEVCEEDGLSLRDDLTVYQDNKFIGRLKEDKSDDGGEPSYQFVTDSDFVGKGKRLNVNKIMHSYSEKVCRRQIGSIGTILERTENERGILLKIAVNA